MLKLIVVDDEKDARDKMIRYIDKEKYGIHIVGAASDGVEACRLIREHSPDIVLIDIEMPGMSGLQVIETVHNEYALTAVVFIIISSHENFSYAQEAIRLGVNNYLLKPFMPSDICEAIYRAAEHIKSLRLLVDLDGEEPGVPLPSVPLFLKDRRIGMDYPHEAEQKVIESLCSGDAEAVEDRLSVFFDRVAQSNEGPARWNCYVILYIEVYHFSIMRKMDLSSLDLNLPLATRAHLEAFEKSLRLLCRATCERLANETKSGAVLTLALRYIEEHYAGQLTLERVAAEAYVSPAYLSTLFTRNLNMHFVDYIHKVRIENAIRLMRENPQLKYYQISERVGYASYKHYAKCFKKVMHVSVSQYQAKMADGR